MDFERQLVSVCPSRRQLRLEKMEFYAFIHFGISTFTDREWGEPDSDLSLFNPKGLDTLQWVRAIKSACMKGVILTCKHHDGFCLWDTGLTSFNVMNTPFGRDILKELSLSCREEGIALGVYLSPWDMTEKTYGTGRAYDDFYVAQLHELLTGYGEIFTVWLDGACGEGANGKRQVYDWERYYETIRALSPGTVIAVTGPDIRWCGNEAGKCRKSEFSVVPKRLCDPRLIADSSQKEEYDTNRLRFISREDIDLGSREALKGESELIWYPAEVDTSIRKGWFYHESENETLKSDEELWQLYLSSVGGNSTLLLNVPPDKNGLFYKTDCERLSTLGERIKTVFKYNLAKNAEITASAQSIADPIRAALCDDERYYMPPDGSSAVDITITPKNKQAVSYIVLMEQIEKSQRIERFDILADDRKIYSGTTVGYKKICQLGSIEAKSFTIRIVCSRIAPTLRFIGLYIG